MEDDELIGKRIEARRTALGFSQASLSQALREAGLNWSQGTLSRVETGSRAVRLSESRTLAQVLEWELEDLAEDPDYLGSRRAQAMSKLHDAMLLTARHSDEADRLGRQAAALSVLWAVSRAHGEHTGWRAFGSPASLVLASLPSPSDAAALTATVGALGEGEAAESLAEGARATVDDWIAGRGPEPVLLPGQDDLPDIHERALRDPDTYEELVDQQYRLAVLNHLDGRLRSVVEFRDDEREFDGRVERQVLGAPTDA